MELSSLKLSPKKAGMGRWEVNLTSPPPVVFPKISLLKKGETLLFVTFNIIISYIFPDSSIFFIF